MEMIAMFKFSLRAFGEQNTLHYLPKKDSQFLQTLESFLGCYYRLYYGIDKQMVVEKSCNYLERKAILESARVNHVA
jgi:hypothetical protein